MRNSYPDRRGEDLGGQSLTGIVGSNPAGGTEVCVVSVMCRQVENSATGSSFVLRIPIRCVIKSDQVQQ